MPITRDLTQLAKRLVARFAAQPVVRTIGVGHSGGALIMQFIAAGMTTTLDGPFAGRRVFTGGNFNTAYDTSSGLVFDGVIPVAGGAPPLSPAFAGTVPIMLVAGTADFSVVDSVVFANRLQRAGVNLNARVRVYQMSGLPHNFAEIVESTPNINQFLADVFGFVPAADGDRLTPVIAALVARMRNWIADGTPPPLSRINGAALDTNGDAVADVILCTQANGGTTSVVPFADDPSRRHPARTRRFWSDLRLLSPRTTWPFRPVLHRESLETNEILVVRCHEHQAMHMSDGGDLSVNEWDRLPKGFKACALFAVPRRSRLVVRQGRERFAHDVTKILFQRCAPPTLWQSLTAVRQLVPHRRRDRAICAVLVKALQNRPIRSL